MPSVSIVIPTYNHYELLHNILYDIYSYNRDVDEVIVIDNGSTDIEVSEGLKWWTTSGMLPISILSIKDNVGFLLACNQGVEKSTGEIILLVSNDVRITRPILEEIKNKLVGKAVLGARLLDYDTGWNSFDGKVFPYLEGWLLGFHKSTWEDLGGFDERYVPADMEDVDFSTSAISKGYVLVTLENSKLVHLGGQTIGFSDARAKITTINKEKFRKKWVENV